MEQAYQTQLSEAGVSDAAIKILDTEELSTEHALKRGYSYADFVAMGIKAGSARILADRYPVSTTTPASVAPTPVAATKLYLGQEPLEERIRAAARGDSEAIASVYQALGDKTVFVRSIATGKMDVEASIACIQFVGVGPAVSKWQKMPTESLTAILVERRFADPLTGATLVPGDAWLDVDLTRRALVTFAIITKTINPQGIDPDLTIERLQRKELTGQWLEVSNAHAIAKVRQDTTVLEAERWLYVGGREGGRSSYAQARYHEPEQTRRSTSWENLSAEDYWNK